MPSGASSLNFSPPGVALYEPEGYWFGWTLIAIAMLIAVAAWFTWVFLRTRTPQPIAPVLDAPWERKAGTRQQHLARLDDIANGVHEGRLSLREGHQQTSAAVRSYVEEAGILPARSMSQADLRSARHGPLADVIHQMYPPEFGPDNGDREAFQAAWRRAREVVATWH